MVDDETRDLSDDGESSEQERELARELVELLSAGRKIEAVKMYRAATGASLGEAVTFVNGVAEQHGLARRSGCSTSTAVLLAVFVVLAWLL